MANIFANENNFYGSAKNNDWTTYIIKSKNISNITPIIITEQEYSDYLVTKKTILNILNNQITWQDSKPIPYTESPENGYRIPKQALYDYKAEAIKSYDIFLQLSNDVNMGITEAMKNEVINAKTAIQSVDIESLSFLTHKEDTMFPYGTLYVNGSNNTFSVFKNLNSNILPIEEIL